MMEIKLRKGKKVCINLLMEKFNISRPTATGHIKKLLKEKKIEPIQFRYGDLKRWYLVR